MKPSLPGFVPTHGNKLIEVQDPLECAMLRFEKPCGNYTRYVLLVPTGRGDQYRLIPFCQMCVDDSGDGWIQALESILEVV